MGQQLSSHDQRPGLILEEDKFVLWPLFRCFVGLFSCATGVRSVVDGVK